MLTGIARNMSHLVVMSAEAGGVEEVAGHLPQMTVIVAIEYTIHI
jgi:hypothetical protein